MKKRVGERTEERSGPEGHMISISINISNTACVTKLLLSTDDTL